MKLTFTPPHGQDLGTIASLLKRSYARLLESDQMHWHPEAVKWERFDRQVFDHPKTVGACVFLSWSHDQLVGFGSFDPRQKPALGIVGHNCILPEFQGRGFGKQQIWHILRHFRSMGVLKVRASTLDHDFFAPARGMYAACGFQEVERHPWDGDPCRTVIAFEKRLHRWAFKAL